jgi:hypothetical protein
MMAHVRFICKFCLELYELEAEEIANFQVIADLTHPEDREACEKSVAISAAMTGATWEIG